MANFDIIVERHFAYDNMIIRDTKTMKIMAERKKKDGRCVWISDYSDLQEICNEWGPWSTAEALAGIIGRYLREIGRK